MGKGKSNEGEMCVMCGAMTFCCFLVVLVIALLGYGIAKIVMGSVYLHDCSIEKLIPIYLIVSGLAPIFFGGFGRKNEDESSSLSGLVCGILGGLFNLAWLICGSVWTYPHFGKLIDFTKCEGNVTTGCLDKICNKNLITFAFASVTIDWMFMGLWIGVFACQLRPLCSRG
ncbi:uncharacterized protein LOC123554417 [Mercenaria mercenaria]|uniref:uncharacterized protein LOC123554417 n=1 Tax=Mercenaria mercenaria TaxID=6596 RepID=UPI00234E5080|nr:uncharacterized protein LOC123554417 [Mercenaria mercenaria]XP_053404080.1 uncharacterized protein LOC123554417 [Mercenaria mercenaria]